MASHPVQQQAQNKKKKKDTEEKRTVYVWRQKIDEIMQVKKS